MKRRRLLHGSGLVLAGALGGCTSVDSGNERPPRTETASATGTLATMVGNEAGRATGTPTSTGTERATARAAVDRHVYVSEVLPNPEGPDAEALGEEYVLVETAGETTLDLSGYSLSYGRRHEYVFPDVVSAVDAGANLEIHTGHGSDSVGTATPPTYSLFVGSDAPLLANDGMRLTLRNAADVTVDSVEYWSMDDGTRYVRPET